LEPGREVAAPRVDVLTEERDLLDTVEGEGCELGHDLARPPALLPPAHGGNDAVGAPRVAPHGDLHPGLNSGLAMHRQLRGEVLVRPELSPRNGIAAGADPVAEVRDRSRAERDVHEREPVEDP